MRTLPAIIIAVAVVLAPAVWLGLRYLLTEEDFQGSAVDSGARIENLRQSDQIEDLQRRLEALESEVARLPVGGAAGQAPVSDEDAEDAILRGTGPNTIIDAYTQVVLIADRRNVNRGLVVSSPKYMEQKLGRPREVLSDECQGMTNESLASKIVLEQVGPVRVRMLAPAVESLKRVFETVKRADPDLYALIKTSGSLCVRRIRGSTNSMSTHSYGLALDLNIDGVLDNFTDGKTQLGLTILADFFNEEGWVWGAGFSREDSMHFEVSRKQLDQWLADGVL
jgi:hypothetical protein